MIEIKEVKSSRDLRRFIAFPHKLYAGNPYWVPALRSDERATLRKDKNPAFAHAEARYWLAYKDGRLAGRIACIINRKLIETWGVKKARFGWIDFIDDREVSGALLGVAEEWARARGMEAIEGPMGFCDLDREGMLIEGFEELGTLATIYNHPYYPVHMEHHGYGKSTDYVEYELTPPPEGLPERVLRINDEVMRRSKFRFAPVKKPKDILVYGKEIFAVLNEAYKHLYGAVPLTEAQIDFYIKQYFSYVNTDLVKVVLDGEGRVAAFAITMPSLSRALQKSGGRLFPFGFIHLMRAMRRNDRLDNYLIAVRPDLQNKGINAMLMIEITKGAFKHGMYKAESNPEWEENKQVQAQWKNFGARQHKRRRIYIKNLAEAGGSAMDMKGTAV